MERNTQCGTDWARELVKIMRKLRAPGGCPWDREQTHQSLKEYLAEEAAELYDAIDDADDEALVEELGDVLLQVVFHATIAAEGNRFDFQDVARVCCEKLVRRHPHFFGESGVGSADEVVKQWDEIKKAEKGTERRSVLSGVPRHLPALHRAHKLQGKAAKVGFDWPSVEGVVAKIEEELGEVKHALAQQDSAAVEEEIGDLLFAVVNLSRFRKRVAEELLHATIKKFERRFQIVESTVARQGRSPADCSLAELEALWQESKHADRKLN